MTSRPRNAIVLARISDARGDGRSVSDQVRDARELADRLRWGIGPDDTHVLREPDTSAFKRRKVNVPGKTHPEWRVVRPEFRRALDMLVSGQADGLIAYDLDRACRDPRDLEDLIDLVEHACAGLPVESVTGSLRLSTDADVTMARVMVAIANKASRDTGRRVARAARTRAENGGHHGGTRAFGYENDGMTVREDEASEIRRLAAALAAGKSLRALIVDLREREVPTVRGGAWQSKVLRDILMNPRVAGLAVHRGEIVGKGRWPAILDEDTWRAVAALLSDPSRRTTPGNAPRWLGSGIYACGTCGDTLYCSGRGGGGKDRRPAYRCRSHHTGPSHVTADARALDRHVIGELLDRLSDPAALQVLNSRHDPHGERAAEEDLASAIAKDETRIRQLRAALADPDAEDIDDLRAAIATLKERIADREARLAAVAARPTPLREFTGGQDAAEVWTSLDLARQRDILRLLARVTVKPSGPGRLPNSLRLPDGTYRIPPERVRVEPL
ncbi:recombinase family protein [Nocardioides ganghwensis]|uniref:Recombinase family protein n=1 Tax=Nocardioides ganghwensis TaxID=252230 RepID=A0A4Q2SH13_9ACTN|nr:recombinase family protein [Nocardioides ganghwensis]MBD3946472.1 recombinase family protein [Nocardioides ganghwensis]RYC03219.1 recombinase family protein [Nocardioides ganghwensis]